MIVIAARAGVGEALRQLGLAGGERAEPALDARAGAVRAGAGRTPSRADAMSLLTNVTLWPTVMETCCGLTPLAVIVIVAPLGPASPLTPR